MNQHLDYNYQPPQSLSPDKFFLLLMNVTRDSRDQLFAQVSPYLDNSLYSYRGRGIAIAGDDPSPGNLIVQTYSNTAWYNATNFSLVAETLPWTGKERLFVTEKTFKPLLAGRPFLAVGQCNTYKTLKELGLSIDFGFDISYDTDSGDLSRIKGIFSAIDHIQNTNLDRLFQSGIDAVRHNLNYIKNNNLFVHCEDLNTESVKRIKDFI